MTDSLSTRQLILNAARELFTLHGYHGTSTRKIAALVGVTEGAIFRHFSSKREILMGLLTPTRSLQLDQTGLNLAEGSPRVVLTQFIHLRIQQFSQLFPLLKIVLLENEVGPELKQAWLYQVLFEVREQLSGCFSRWQASAEIRSEIEPDSLARLFMTQTFGALFLNQVSEGLFFNPQNIQDQLELSLDLFLKSVIK